MSINGNANPIRTRFGVYLHVRHGCTVGGLCGLLPPVGIFNRGASLNCHYSNDIWNMKRSQFFRLTLVLLLPLLGLGLWMAKEQTLFPSDHYIYCERGSFGLWCAANQKESWKIDDERYGYGAVHLWKAALPSGFHHEVIVIRSTNPRLGSSETVPVESGKRQWLNLSRTERYFGRCEITVTGHSSDAPWGLFCEGDSGSVSEFVFVNPTEDKQYRDALKRVSELEDEYTKRGYWGEAANLLAPLLAYFLLALGVVSAKAVVRFVIHGNQRKPEREAL